MRAANPLGSEEVSNRLYVRTEFDSSIEGKDLIVVNAPSFFHVAYFGSMRITSGQPVPKRLRVFATGTASVDLFRPDDRTVIVRPAEGFFQGFFDRLYRSDSDSMPVGETIVLDGMTVEVVTVGDNGCPAEVSFRLDVPLEDDSLLWLKYAGGEFVFMTPPAIGERVHLPASPPIFSF